MTDDERDPASRGEPDPGPMLAEFLAGRGTTAEELIGAALDGLDVEDHLRARFSASCFRPPWYITRQAPAHLEGWLLRHVVTGFYGGGYGRFDIVTGG